jgi:hypothetical protein
MATMKTFMLMATLMIAMPAFAQAPQVPALADLPAAIKPPEGLNVYRAAYAIGVQIYTCSKNDSGSWTWNFKAPEAVLVDPGEKLLGKHAAGPSWEGLDGGRVVGSVKAGAPSPNNSIPWLLLDIKSREGNGEFTQAKAILRVSTAGGVAPTESCDEAHSGSERRVHYTGVYLFLK